MRATDKPRTCHLYINHGSYTRPKVRVSTPSSSRVADPDLALKPDPDPKSPANLNPTPFLASI